MYMCVVYVRVCMCSMYACMCSVDVGCPVKARTLPEFLSLCVCCRTYVLAVHPDALGDYQGVDTSDPNCVVLADATDTYTYQTLNQAFRLLMDLLDRGRGTLIALGKG